MYEIIFLLLLCSKFKECPHPGPDVRQEVGTKIGLEARQVKFWFQNRRSQQKASTHLTTILLHVSASIFKHLSTSLISS